MARLVAIVVLVGVLLGGVSVPTTAQTQTDAQVAAETAGELSYFEAIGDFNALYDRIHPDAHAVIPRAAVIGWYQNEFWPRGPGVATVTGVRFVSWTWQVTGQTYPYTAEVSFQQPFADGSVLEDVVRLVLDDTGQWRWFFGRSREFVDEQIAKYVPQVQATSGNVVDYVIGDLNAFWSVSFAAAGRTYVAPTIVTFVPGSVSGCGYLGEDVGPAAYCGSDMTIYLDPDWLGYFNETIGDFAWITVLAHEWGHHVQRLDGVAGTRKAVELQADCLAGSYARDAGTRGLLDPGDVTEAVVVSGSSGDAAWLPDDAEGAHGSGDERITAFMRGYLDGFLGCNFLSSGAGTTVTDTSQPSADLTALLPRQGEVPSDLILVGDQQRTLQEVAINYTDPVETQRLFRSWGWTGNVTRTYEGSGASSGISSVYVSVHRFGNADSAAAALDYSLTDQAASTGAREVPVSPVGQTTRALQTATDVTIYVQQGDVMIRITVVGQAGTAMSTAASIVQSVLARTQ